MSKTGKVIVLLAICSLILFLPASGTKPGLAQTSSRPNIILLLTDDLDVRSISHMPILKSLMTQKGVKFNNAYVTDSLCCPSRATILRGQYSHNHKVLTNSLPLGGFQRFHDLGRENSTIATWLHSGGYRTVLLGKYLNDYPSTADPTYVPPGWDEWYATIGNTTYQYYNYDLNENGKKVSYGSDGRDYKTDVLSRKATGFISRTESNDDQPFFMYLAPIAPHRPATPPYRYENSFSDLKAPRPPSFNESDVSDKPDWVSSRSPLSAKQIDNIDKLYRDRLRTLLAVDDMIESLVNRLRDTGELGNTYIVFTSDNGLHMGAHRLKPGKWTAYEEDTRVPLVVRGPGVPVGRTRDHIVLNNDFAPTFAEWGVVPAADFVDGRSFASLLTTNPPPLSNWRTAFLIEAVAGDSGGTDSGGIARPSYKAVHTQNRVYVRYGTGERELYRLDSDPYELHSKHKSADPDNLARLQSRLTALKDCSGDGCRTAEGP